MAEKVDILFINPGNRSQIYQSLSDEFCAVEPPVFPGLFATYARRKGLRVAILDGPAHSLSAEEIAARALDDYDAALIAIVVYGFQPSASTQNMTAAGEIARHIRDGAPKAKILMMGTHPAALPERTVREESIDFVCDREGPATLVKTVRALQSGASDYSAIPSLWWRDGARIVAPLTSEALEEDLDNGHAAVLAEMISGAQVTPGLGAEIAARIRPWQDFAVEAISETLNATPAAGLLPAQPMAHALVALYLGLEMLSSLEGDRAAAREVFDQADVLAALLDLFGRTSSAAPEQQEETWPPVPASAR